MSAFGFGKVYIFRPNLESKRMVKIYSYKLLPSAKHDLVKVGLGFCKKTMIQSLRPS